MSVAVTQLFVLSVVLWVVGGTWAYWGSVIAGFSQGVRFSLAIILMAKKSGNAREMMLLSSLTQAMGYLIGAAGPFICGFLYQGRQCTFTVYVFFLLAALLWGIAAFIGFGRAEVFRHRS